MRPLRACARAARSRACTSAHARTGVRVRLEQTPFLKTCLSYADSLRPLPPPPSGWPEIEQKKQGEGEAAAGAADAGAGGGGGAAAGAAIHTAPLESFWCVPILRVFVIDSNEHARTRTTAEQAELEAKLIEHFLALLSMPKPLLGLAAAKAVKGKAVEQPPSAETLLAKADEELSQKLTSMLGVTGIDAMLLPYAQRLAVGFFSADVTAFVWDLCLLAGWQQLQPALAAALICMREGLMTTGAATAVKANIATQAPLLSIDQMQRALNSNFMADLRQSVGAPPPQQAFELTPGGSWS